MRHHRVHTAIIAVTLASVTAALAQPTPVPKVGACPAGFVETGGFCTLMSGTTRTAIIKAGQCPANWITSGAYCLSPPAPRR